MKSVVFVDMHNMKFKWSDLGMPYTKLYCWKLIEFSKCVFLDADTIVSLVLFCGFFVVAHLFNMIRFIFVF